MAFILHFFACVAGHVTLDEMMTRLIHAVEVFQGQKQADIAEEVPLLILPFINRLTLNYVSCDVWNWHRHSPPLDF